MHRLTRCVRFFSTCHVECRFLFVKDLWNPSLHILRGNDASGYPVLTQLAMNANAEADLSETMSNARTKQRI